MTERSDFKIRSRRVLIDEEIRPATIVVKDGKIAALSSYESAETSGGRFEDAGDRVVLPGIVDTHAHINEPGRTDWEGFQTATRAAAAGGITSVIDMPLNSIPATTTLEALLIKAKTASRQCAIDYGFWGGVVPGNSGELIRMIDAGALGFKAFLCESGVDEFPMSREEDLRAAMPILAAAGVPLLIHAELESAPFAAMKPRSTEYRDYLESRPSRWEVDAIRMMIRLARETGCRVHIVHLSAADALSDLREARVQGVPITAETCPHYLFFEAERIQEGATQFKCAPPIRDHDNREKLWSGLKDGTIQFIVSDHSPCTGGLKLMDTGDFSRAWGGISGLQFSLPVVWTEMKRRGFSLAELSRLMSANTARFAGLDTIKGKIAEGLDADLVVFDPEKSFRVDTSIVLHKNKITPYTGYELHGRIHRTYVRGTKIYDREESPPLHPTVGVGTQLFRSVTK